MSEAAIQDQLHGNLCFGCGADNPDGLQIKSYWDGETATCTFAPQPHHTAGPPHVVNGGIMATIIDCHGICTAMAAAYQREGRPIGSNPLLWHVTGRLDVQYLKPTAIKGPVDLTGRVVETGDRKTTVEVIATCGGVETAKGTVVCIRVPPDFLEA
jgi:acyl-coenzyme A thioesterase PaaI-like protein